MNSQNQISKSKLFNELYARQKVVYTDLEQYSPIKPDIISSYSLQNCEYYINPTTQQKYTYNSALNWWNYGILNFTDTKGSFESIE